jgi:hypothetical protein
MTKPENNQKIVYKYRNWEDENHKNLLSKNQLFLASTKDFNDPFDCRIPANYTLINSEEKIDQYLQILKNDYSAQLLQEGRNIEKEILIVKDKLLNEIDTIQNTEEKNLYKLQDKHYGILSLSARWDSILMWSHYSDYHQGYCVGFWTEQLIESNLFGAGGYVDYNVDNDFPEISPLNRDIHQKSFLETHSKSNDWYYEQEYRLIKLSFPEPHSITSRIKTISDKCYAEILLGLNISPVGKLEIIEIAQRKNIPIYQMMKVPWKFKLDRIEIK